MKNELSKELAKLIREKVEESDNRIYEQYSGRGMYGQNCFGLTINRHSSEGVVSIIMQVMGELKNRNNTSDTKEELEIEMLELDYDVCYELYSAHGKGFTLSKIE